MYNCTVLVDFHEICIIILSRIIEYLPDCYFYSLHWKVRYHQKFQKNVLESTLSSKVSEKKPINQTFLRAKIYYLKSIRTCLLQ